MRGGVEFRWFLKDERLGAVLLGSSFLGGMSDGLGSG